MFKFSLLAVNIAPAILVTCFTHKESVGGRGGERTGWGVGGTKYPGEGRGGFEGCFVFTSWLTGAFDFIYWGIKCICQEAMKF